jgi:hypothetical protein
MTKKKVTVLTSILASLSFICLPLMGQTVTGNEVRAVKSVGETRPGRVEFRESGEWLEAGKLQLRAAARPWPDSTVTFTALGERQRKTVYTYDAAGRQTLSESYSWTGSTWVNSSKSVYAYDAAGNRTLSEGYSWAGGTWVNSYKYVYAYDAAGHQTLYEYYTGENNQWKGNAKETNAYDSRGVNVLKVNYSWTNNAWIKSSESSYDRKTADSKTYINVMVFYNADGSMQSTALFVEGSGLNAAPARWEEQKMEYQATYDASDRLTLVETTVLRDGKRVPSDRYVLQYSSSNPVSIEVYGYNVNDFHSEAWLKAANTYDTRGNLTLSESYQYEGSAVGWTGLNRWVRTYDASGRVLSYESYIWNTSSGGWIGSWKSASTYDANGRELSYESYNWNTSSGGWIGSWKTTYEEINEYGDVMLSKSWEWINSGWAWASYTVSYPGGIGPSGTEYIGGAEPSVYIYGDRLRIQTVSAEQIGIYTLNGAKVYESAVSPGATAISAERLPKGVLIVRGSSGWARKVFAR